MIRSFLLAATALVPAAVARQKPATHRVLAVSPDCAVQVEGVGWLRLQGVDGRSKALRTRLRGLCDGSGFEVTVDGKDPAAPRLVVGVLRRPGAARSLNEELLEAGLGFFRTRTDRCRDQTGLLAAALRAKAAGAGVWRGVPAVAGAVPKQPAGSLGLYYKVEKLDYHEQLDRVKASGASWVQLLLTVFVDKVDSSRIELDKRRTVSDARLRETIAYARKKGLRVALLPIVLIRHAGDDDWRGTLRPSDPGRFWRSYDDFLCRYLDIARESGVEMFSVGSELCSLERETAVWVRLIQNARGRYAGWLTYSVNWDHYDVPQFWHLLDQVGMTAYFELTDKKDPTVAELTQAWRKVRTDLAGVAKRLGRPIVLTELGYASQNGTNTAPWNYYLAQDDIDLQEQADCFTAFTSVMKDAPFLHGVYVFGFFERGGPQDHTYAVWGKPAWPIVKKFLTDFR